VRAARGIEEETMAALTIDFVSDILCPWCFIGFTRLEQALVQASEESAEVTLRPFLLDPSTPPEGADLRQRLAAKYGIDPETMFGRVEAAARESGIALDFAKIRRTPNTLKAHVLLGAARAKGTQRALARALFEAYFLHGRDVGDDEVLAETAAPHGLASAEVAAILADGAALEAIRSEAAGLAAEGIGGVPFTVFDGKLALSGAQPLATFRAAIEQARASG
jgi:predicted DsbA family dithiol-disulfide isomerase